MGMTGPPSVFISYAWSDVPEQAWVQQLAERLQADGVNVWLDRWLLRPGVQLPGFMESAIREADFVLITCTPSYKATSDARSGGVGYEGDVITGEIPARQESGKFIPVLRTGEWVDAAPSWHSDDGTWISEDLRTPKLCTTCSSVRSSGDSLEHPPSLESQLCRLCGPNGTWRDTRVALSQRPPRAG
jgi:hypothetical protein